MALQGDLGALADLEEVEVAIEKLVAGGDGLARVQGVPVFVPRSVPGDRLRVRLTERRPQYARGAIVEILEPGEGRREPPCPLFEVCGGCDLQQIEDRFQGRLKVAAAREALRRIGKLESLPDSRLLEGRPFHYRSRTQLQIREEDGEVRVGYFARGSHDLVDVERCPVLVPALEAQLESVAGVLPPSPPVRLDLAVGDDDEITCSPVVVGLPRGAIRRSVAGFEYAFDARAFFQVHGDLLEDLVHEVCGPWSGSEAWDLYAGVGLFSLPLARKYDRVRAVESDAVTARFARKNARSNQRTNVEVRAQSLETYVPELPKGIDRVVANPPRSGLSRRVSNMLALRAPKRLTYLSCHPASLARDLKILSDVFEVESLTFFDLFPQTGHIETLVQLVTRAAR